MGRKVFRLFLVLSLSIFLLGFYQLTFAKEVVLYSSNPSEVIDMVCKGFNAKTGIKVSAVRMGTGTAMKRIKAEKDNPLGDLFWSGDVAVLDGAKAYFMPYKSPEAKVLPPNYVEKNYRWTSTNVHVMIIMYNKKLVKENEKPKYWKDLFLSKWKGKVVMANPEKSGSAYAQAYGLYKLYGWDGLKKLIANAKILDSSSLIYKGVAAGEYPVGITMEYAAYRYIAGGSKDVGIIYPEDGAFVAPEGAAIIKNCKHQAEAKQFFDYLLSKDVEAAIFQKFFRRPARADAATFKGLPKLTEIKVMSKFDPMEANKLKKEILKKWKEIILSK
ncbi:MAG: ABC transporter substrate-binding protein [Deltaproteobacteria bacterium]|nr:extracellular solute-binding protein [Deltaproteobacteria bacterium]RLA90670.1 MAG: ABC transporter substrate-binding protein [Deltaproteobacteria bacterium]